MPSVTKDNNSNLGRDGFEDNSAVDYTSSSEKYTQSSGVDLQENYGKEDRVSARSSMRDTNFAASRKTLFAKYDLNGDGNYDNEEVNAIIDDYMTTIRNNIALVNTNQGLKKLIVFSAIMIILLSLSNFATAFLAVSLSKEIKVKEGTLISNDDAGTALKTLSKVEKVTVLGPVSSDASGRRLMEVENRLIACLTKEEVMKIYSNAQESAGTSLIVKGERGAEASYDISGTSRRSIVQNFVPLGVSVNGRRLSGDNIPTYYDNGYVDENIDENDMTNFIYRFPDSNSLMLHAPDLCAKRRRLQIGGNTDPGNSQSDFAAVTAGSPTTCPANMKKIKVQVNTDDKSNENKFSVWKWNTVTGVKTTNVWWVDSDSFPANRTEYVFEGCLLETNCYKFYMRDIVTRGGGDGMCCGYGDGGYKVWYNDVLIKDTLSDLSFAAVVNVTVSLSTSNIFATCV